MESDKIKEIWKDVPGYEGYYQVSNLGRVRSLDRTVFTKNGHERFYKGRVIKGQMHNGYRRTTLKVDGRGRCLTFSQLVAMAFLNHKPNGSTLVIDHINGDRGNDRVENLRIVTHRANTSTCFRSNEESFSSRYVGVHWSKANSKWIAQIIFNERSIHLGYFTNELKASYAYQSAVSKIKEGSFNPSDYKPKFTSKYKGVSLYKPTNRWRARITINSKMQYLGYFPTELEAHHAYQSALKSV